MSDHLHNCKTLLDTSEIVIDYCIECKKRLIYRKCRRTGRIDNQKYKRDHKRDLLQWYDKEYERYYGNSKTKEIR